MEEIPIEKWKVKFLNLPCDEQIYFAHKTALDESLHNEYVEWLKEQQDS
ncbi:hypothetical protein ACFSCX_10255 [Bacillus salitolerans]|uniref:Uncharacterized protein n=1 Tax=Bacillus salitolerans TaxID=1437434 RepID=A0ABW4LQ71_9BACI